ncbi:MAG: hypothetical protein HGB12_01975 [Bacteroidetes bacterium]|nr:hypothetical protein [Bacteroidota bacterium]
MKKNHLVTLLISASLLTFSSCSDYPGYKKSDTGLYYKFHVENDDAQKPEMGDVLTINMSYKLMGKDTFLFNSKDMPETSRLMLIKPVYKESVFSH